MDPRSQDPSTRLKNLVEFANSCKVESRIPIQRYFRSGKEMLRMADVYYKEGCYENAYTLYLKFLTIFIEKIIQHPEYHTISLSEKSQFNGMIKEVFPKTEMLKRKILEKFHQDYDAFQEENERKKKQEEVMKVQRDLEALYIKEKQEALHKELSKANQPAESKIEPAHSKSEKRLVEPKPSYSANEVPISPEYKTLFASAKAVAVPSVDRSLKPRSELSTPGLKKVVVPASLLNEFIVLAHSNTENNIETCGILAGKLAHNQFWITHLLIPKQKGNSDSCTTQNEEELFEVQDKHNLVTLGWIHTHPTQTAFLSSVDLHTHCSYQLMMPEAIAIVCAPKYNETGYFTLTTNHGLDCIASCRLQGFHPHPSNPPLFEVASHIEVHPNAPVSVVDMRHF